MSTHVVGLRAPTPQHLKMLAAWRANEEAELEQPQKLRDYFGDHWPAEGDDAMIVAVPKSAVKEYQGDYCSGFDVNLSKLPGGVTSLRFYNSW